MMSRLTRPVSGRLLIVVAVALAAGAISCGTQRNGPVRADETDGPSAGGAVAILYPTEGQVTRGQVTFSSAGRAILVAADLEGLSPGPHGIHVHEYGDCSAPDGAAAGGHFNPVEVAHGGPDDPVRHVGDLGNLIADSTGATHFERRDTEISLAGSHSIIGRAVIIHAGADDLTSQPSGAAGARVACGVIGIAGP